MRNRISAIIRPAAMSLIFLAASIGEGSALELILPREAALPDAAGTTLNLSIRGVSRGPKVAVISPAPDAGTVRSPFHLLLRFETHGGATIDPRFVKVIYLKRPAVNLTQRLNHLITEDGIEVHSADAPPGTHYIKVEIRDSAGRIGSTTFALMVAD
jgi:hypothetical protein